MLGKRRSEFPEYGNYSSLGVFRPGITMIYDGLSSLFGQCWIGACCLV